jgi:murein L,D-transpeptidase YcbB/YkuD
MSRNKAGRLFAGALLAVVVAAPIDATAQEQVVVPIPQSFNDKPAGKSNDTAAPPPTVIAPIPNVAAKPASPVNGQSAARNPTPAPKAESKEVAPAPKSASTKPLPVDKKAERKETAAAPVAPAKSRSATKTATNTASGVPLPAKPPAHAAAPSAAAGVPMPPVKEKRTARNAEVPMPRSAPDLANAPKAASAEPANKSEEAAQKSNTQAGTEKTATIDPALSEADAQVAAKLQELITGKHLGRAVSRTADRKAIETFYNARGYAPLWTHDGDLTARAKTVIARFNDAAADGLDPSSYRVPDFPAGKPETLAASDLALTGSLLTFARHLSDGRITPSRVYGQVDYGDHTPAPADILKTVAQANDVDAAIESFNPPDRDFRALKSKLAELRAHKSDSHIQIPGGGGILPGKDDDRVPLLRERMGLKGRSTTYDKTLVRAVRKLQAEHGINPSGIVGPKTLGMLNGSATGASSDVVDRIVINMERWRWMPRELGTTYVMVNIPDYTLKLVHRNRVVWRTKIVAGKPATPTPLASATMDSVIVNPSWHVPQSIIQNELLPRYENDPYIFERMGLEVKRGSNGNIMVVQPPGAANALGQIKFNFPNRFQVYLHDTPQKRLFKSSKRAFSHGCMRVENPTKFGELILHYALKRKSPDAREIQAMFGDGERVFRLANQPRVHLTYQTAFVDSAGKLQLRDDVYGLDGRTDDILHGRPPRMAAAAPPPAPKRHLRIETSNNDLLRRVERQEAYNPPDFNPLRIFDEIFR